MVYRKKMRLENNLLQNKKYTYLGSVLSNLIELKHKSLPSLAPTQQTTNKQTNKQEKWLELK